MTDPVARDRPRTEASDATEPTWPEDPHAMQDGPSVHHFGWRSKGEWDIPFGSWTLLRATDADGREHIFHVPTAALPSSAPHPDRLERALNRLPDRHSATIQCVVSYQFSSGNEFGHDHHCPVPWNENPHTQESDDRCTCGWSAVLRAEAARVALAETPGEPR